MPNLGRSFTREFKTEAVCRVIEQGHSLAEVGRDPLIGESNLRSWKQVIPAEGEHGFPSKLWPPALDEELRCLRAEVKRLTTEREILKEAMAFFGWESSCNTTSSRPTAGDGQFG